MEQDLGKDSVVLATALHNFADNYRFQEDYAAAEPLLRRSLDIYERALGGEDPLVAATLTNLADVLRGSHKPADALPLLQRALRIRETALPPNHPDAGQTLIALADVSISLGDTDQAIQHLNRAATLFRNGLGADHSYVAVAYHRLGQVYASRENWNEAVQAFEECASIIARRTLRDTASLGAAISGSAQSEALRVRIAFDDFLNAAHHQVAREAGNLAGVRIAASKSFSFAQWAQNSAAAGALLQQSIRAAGPGAVPALMRERDELIAQWSAADRRVISFLSQPLVARDPAAESALRGELAAIDARVSGIDRTIAVEFPDYAAKYAAWASPEPLTLDAAKSLLGDNEALAFFLDAGDMYLWLVTKIDSRWLRIDPGSTDLDDRVSALRCGLDSAMWLDDEGEFLPRTSRTGAGRRLGARQAFALRRIARPRPLHRAVRWGRRPAAESRRHLEKPARRSFRPAHPATTQRPRHRKTCRLTPLDMKPFATPSGSVRDRR